MMVTGFFFGFLATCVLGIRQEKRKCLIILSPVHSLQKNVLRRLYRKLIRYINSTLSSRFRVAQCSQIQSTSPNILFKNLFLSFLLAVILLGALLIHRYTHQVISSCRLHRRTCSKIDHGDCSGHRVVD